MSRGVNKLLSKQVAIADIAKSDKIVFSANQVAKPEIRINAAQTVNGLIPTIFERPNIQTCEQKCLDKYINFVYDSGQGEGTQLIYKFAADDLSIFLGYLTFYTKNLFTAKVTLSETIDFANADAYTVEANNFTVIDLVNNQPEIIGSGFSPNEAGYFYLKIENFSLGLRGEVSINISTIEFYKSKYDFMTNQVIVLSCLNDLSGAFEKAVTEQSCFSGGWDNNETMQITKSIKAKAITKNYICLNPSAKRDYAIHTGSRHIQISRNLDENNRIFLPDLNEAECGYIAVFIKDNCDGVSRQLQKVDANIELGDYDFKIVKIDDKSYIECSEYLKDTPLIVEFPKKVRIRRMTISNANVGEMTFKMSYEHYLSDGTVIVYHANNVFPTSFNDSNLESESTLDLEITIQSDENNNLMTRDEIME